LSSVKKICYSLTQKHPLAVLNRLFLSIILTCIAFNLSARQTAQKFQFLPGDFIFQDLDCGPMCDAIEEVTQGYEGRRFSHVGMVVDTALGRVSVIEAMGPGVRIISLDSFAAANRHPMLVGRVKPEYNYLLDSAVRFAVAQVGIPYDDEFLYDNGMYYCSELLYDAFLHAGGGTPLFTLEPMTFRRPGSAHFYPVWEAYYKALGIAIPEGAPGCNPGGLSRSPKIDIIHSFSSSKL